MERAAASRLFPRRSRGIRRLSRLTRSLCHKALLPVSRPEAVPRADGREAAEVITATKNRTEIRATRTTSAAMPGEEEGKTDMSDAGEPTRDDVSDAAHGTSVAAVTVLRRTRQSQSPQPHRRRGRRPWSRLGRRPKAARRSVRTAGAKSLRSPAAARSISGQTAHACNGSFTTKWLPM